MKTYLLTALTLSGIFLWGFGNLAQSVEQYGESQVESRFEQLEKLN